MELTKLGGSDDPLEGTNITLRCQQQMLESYSFNETIQMKWFIIESESEEPVLLNETNLPEGLNRLWYRREILYNWSKFLLSKEWILQMKWIKNNIL